MKSFEGISQTGAFFIHVSYMSILHILFVSIYILAKTFNFLKLFYFTWTQRTNSKASINQNSRELWVLWHPKWIAYFHWDGNCYFIAKWNFKHNKIFCLHEHVILIRNVVRGDRMDSILWNLIQQISNINSRTL